MQPRHLPDIRHLRFIGAGARQQPDDLRGLLFDRGLIVTRFVVEAGAQCDVPCIPVGARGSRAAIGIDGRAKTLIARQRPQIQAFDANAHQPETRIDERAEQAERRHHEPVRRDRHAERAGIERSRDVRTRAHVWVDCSARARNCGGTNARSVASRIAMRIWNSMTSGGTGF